MPQFTTAERPFFVQKYFDSKSNKELWRLFPEAFPGPSVLDSTTMWRNVRKHESHGTGFNGNKDISGRKRAENIRSVVLQDNPQVQEETGLVFHSQLSIE